jgi:AraC-like DNA-binding protein
VKKWRKRFAERRTLSYDDPRCGKLLANDWAEAIPSMLKERPWLSCKALCRHFRIAKRTCLWIFYDMLGMKRFHLCWVACALDMNQKTERVTLSYGILSELQRIRSTGFQSVITGDESWSFSTIPVIWYGCRHERKRQKEPVAKLTQKSV